MKKASRLHLLCLSLLSSLSFAHEGVELGPNGGRILEFSKNETLHGELTVKDDRFHIALLNKDMKPLALAEQKLTATTGDREAPRKLEVARDARGFVLPAVKPGEWLILQFRNSPAEKAVTARFEYNTAICEECRSPEWICKCRPDAEKK